MSNETGEPEIDDAIAAAVKAIQRQHDPEAWNRGYEPTAFDLAEGRAAVAAAASHIAGPAWRDGYEQGRAEGAAAERDRIRELAASKHAWYSDEVPRCTDPDCASCDMRPITGPFADLLEQPCTR